MTQKKIIILGGGISALAAAFFLKESFKDVHITIVEKSDRLGGFVHTVEKERFLFELGPRSLRPFGAGEVTLSLIEKLGLQDQVIKGSNDAKKRYIWMDGRLQGVPHNLTGFLFSPVAKDFIRALFQDIITKKLDDDDPSVYDFAKARFGKKFADLYMDAMATGVYAGDIKRLSVKSCFPFLYELEKEHRSCFLGMIKRKNEVQDNPFLADVQKSSLYSFTGGMKTLIDALSGKIEADVCLSRNAIQIKKSSNGAAVHLDDGAVLKADHVISTLSARGSAGLFDENYPRLKSLLRSISCTSIAVVNIGYQKKIPHPPGFGYLIPSCQKEEVLGCVFDSSVFPEQNQGRQTRLTVMIGGAHMENFNAHSKDDFEAMSYRALDKHLGIREKPDHACVWVHKKAIPQYVVGHSRTVDEIQKEISAHFPSVSLLGNSYLGASVNDCVSNANNLVKKLSFKH